MSEEIITSIHSQMKRIEEIISDHNKRADIDGLFSQHVLKDVPDFKIEWITDCSSQNWTDKNMDEKNVYHIAALGYSTKLHIDDVQEKARQSFERGLEIIKKRNHFTGSHLSFPFQPTTFLGLVLGAKSIGDEKTRERYLEWFTWVLKERCSQGDISSFHDLFYNHIEYHLRNQPAGLGNIDKYSTLEELSFIEWGQRTGFFILPGNQKNVENMRKKILRLLIDEDLSTMEPEKAAIIWASVNFCITKGIGQILISPHHVSSILNRFQSAMRRWRYDHKSKNPIKWPITQEREVQDITWLILRSYFNDLVDEETLPKFGHSSYKPDFGIPSIGLLVEVKYARKKGDFKNIEKEVMEDSIGYLQNTDRYNKIIVFIYDHSCSVQEHEETKRALKKLKQIEDVIIVSRPSQLPL